MLKETLTIKNKTGLHGGEASNLVKLTKDFSSKIEIIKNSSDHEVIIDAKSIIMVMAGGLAEGTTIVIRCDGPDEAEAMAAVRDYINNLSE